jgi:hypothetical protein
MMVAGGGTRPYDIAPDGRFFIIRSGQGEAGSIASNMIVVLNWVEELKRLVPTK